MDVKTFFSLLFALMAIGVLVSLTATPPTPLPTLTLGFNATNLITPRTVCVSPVPFWCDFTDWGASVSNIIWAVLGFVGEGGSSLIGMMAFVTGIGAIVTGGMSLPSPLNVFLITGIGLMWLFIALEVGRRIVGVLWGT